MSVLTVILLLQGCAPVGDNSGGTLEIRYFYMNVCASCDEHEEFLRRFESLTGISVSSPNLEIHTHNVYLPYEMHVFEQIAAEAGLDAGKQVFPVLLVGGRVVGESGIDNYLDNGGFEESVPAPDFTVPAGASTAIYFYVPGCADCDRVNSVLDSLPDYITYAGRESPIHIMRISAAGEWGLALFRTYCDFFGIPAETQKTPAVFVGYKALLGADEIHGVESALLNGGGLDTPLLKPKEAQADGGQGLANIPGALAAGLVNGLNPCSISMLLMLFSLLAVKGRWIAPVGLMFLAGKFIGFLLLGTVLYNSINSLYLTELRRAITIIIIIFSSAMIILNANDIVAAKKQDYKNIRLQLPRKLRRFNHALINRAASSESPVKLIAGGAILGLVISAGEFLCTGQIYVMMILSALNSGTNQSAAAFLLLVIYSAAFIAPPAVLILLISRGKKLFDMSEFFRANLIWIKLLNVVVFSAILVLTVFA